MTPAETARAELTKVNELLASERQAERRNEREIEESPFDSPQLAALVARRPVHSVRIAKLEVLARRAKDACDAAVRSLTRQQETERRSAETRAREERLRRERAAGAIWVP